MRPHSVNILWTICVEGNINFRHVSENKKGGYYWSNKTKMYKIRINRSAFIIRQPPALRFLSTGWGFDSGSTRYLPCQNPVDRINPPGDHVGSRMHIVSSKSNIPGLWGPGNEPRISHENQTDRGRRPKGGGGLFAFNYCLLSFILGLCLPIHSGTFWLFYFFTA